MTNTNNTKQENCLARDKEFMSIYNDAVDFMLKNHVTDPFNSALHWAIEHGQPHYNLSYTRAYRVVCQMLTEGNVAFTSPLRKMMWEEISEKVRALMALRPSMSIAHALDFVLSHSRASRFFFTPRQAKRGILRCRKQRWQKLQQTMKQHQS